MLIKWWWRFHTENQVIWRKVICSIHGPLGGLNDNSSVRPNSGPWYHIAKIKDDLLKININLDNIFKIKLGDGQSTSFWNDIWIGDMPLVVSFPRLHRLDINPDCLICDRNPIARASLSALATTSDVTHHFVQLTNNGSMSPYLPPGWECTIDTSRRFSVKGMRYFITSMSHSISSTATLWNKVVPSFIITPYGHDGSLSSTATRWGVQIRIWSLWRLANYVIFSRYAQNPAKGSISFFKTSRSYLLIGLLAHVGKTFFLKIG
ncbi:hypothetical protein Tco_0379572 [Tanacetum coccineum]